MLELSLRFTSDETAENSTIFASFFRPDTGTTTNPQEFTPPLDDKHLAEIRWYLEHFSLWPSGPDYQRAEGIEAQFEDWGKALRDSVLIGEAQRTWQQFIDSPDQNKLLTIDATDPRVLRLPWELLADNAGHLFRSKISVRRRLQNATTPAQLRDFQLPIRILVVVARPEDAGLIDARAVSRPLMDALDELGERVVTEFLYPPTLKALNDRLEDETAQPVHVLHFDGHGVYDGEHGLGYLAFEDDQHKTDLVDANRLGNILNNCGVPLMVLNACQSAAQQENNPYASVAARLIRAGVRNVLAMNYSVLVVAARKFVAAFYEALVDGLTIGRAVDRGRGVLMADPARHTLTRTDQDGHLIRETTRLFDWFLPALYQQAADSTVFPASSDEISAPRTLPRTLTDERAPGGLPADPRYGFHGRSRELLRLERELATHNVVVVHGFGGMGKTTLAAEAGRWFYRTGRFPGGAAFISFEFGGSLSTLCSWVGAAVSGNPDFMLGEGDPVARITELLRQKPALIILDNFESVLGDNPIMPSEELRAVLDAVWTWAGTGTGRRKDRAWGSRVLITTRDTNISDERFQPSRGCAHLPISGLGREDALDLARELLDAQGIDAAKVPLRDLIELIEHLGGHPLSLNLVLPHLAKYSPAHLIEDFEKLLPGFTSGAAKARNESLDVSLEFSLRRLGTATREALPALAVFEGAAFESGLLHITEIDPDLWRTARAELEAAALVKAEDVPGVIPPFLRFHPTLLPYLARQLPGERRTALEGRYWQYYHQISTYLYQQDTPNPHMARAIAVRDMPNLKHGFELALAAAQRGEVEAGAAIDFADSIGRFLDIFGRRREREALLTLLDSLDGEGKEGEGLTKARYLLLSQRGEGLLAQRRAAEGERLFRIMLAEMDQGTAYPSDYDRALTLGRLGRCLAAQGQPAQAVTQHQLALDIFQRLSAEDTDAKEMASKLYVEIGGNLMSLGQFDAAEEAYEAGLVIAREVDDRRTVGVILGQLGSLAISRRQYDEARKRYQEALQTFSALDEPAMEAVAWHQLGLVAKRQEQWDEAERYHRESLRLKESQNNVFGIASTCIELATVTEYAGRLDEAERWNLRAIALYEQLGDQPYLSTALNNLADLYLGQNRLAEAWTAAERAAKIKETLDLSAEPWTTYNILAQIAAKQGRDVEAGIWRRKERETQDAFAGTRYELARTMANMAAVIRDASAVAQGNTEARSALENAFPGLEQNGWMIGDPIQRIWDGERDPEVLTAMLDYSDRAIVLTVLHRLGVRVPAVIAEVDAQIRGGDNPQIKQVLQQFDEVINGVVAAVQGNSQARTAVEGLLPQITAGGFMVAKPIQRIWNGERDVAALTAGLDMQDSAIVRAILDRLDGSIAQTEGTPAEAVPAESQPEATGGESQSMTLDQVFGLVAQSQRKDAPAGLGARLYAMTQQLLSDVSAPPGIRALGRVLGAILSGDRAPSLDGLSPELAAGVQRLLEALGEAE